LSTNYPQDFSKTPFEKTWHYLNSLWFKDSSITIK
jgi:hypothetical protein